MMRKRLLCIGPHDLDPAHFLCDAMPAWDVRCVTGLAEAGREFRDNHYLVGLLVKVRQQHRADEIDAFLRRHSQVRWVGVFHPHELEGAACRDMVAEHLHDYHSMPVDPVRLAHTLGHAYGCAVLHRRPERVTGTSTGDGASLLVGNSEAMARLRSQVERVARVEAPVLIWGESGSGKELTAQAIHGQSERANGPFVPINCGAIPPTLIHSELFGYERGAFTGAARAKVGLIESAHGGTLFLDEIGDLPKDMQASLLRFLQEKTIYRVGSTQSIRVDVRVVAASHVQLQQAVASGNFREDLYYRLAVLPVSVPPLRLMRDDMVTLAEHYFDLYASESQARLRGFSNSAIAAIHDHPWPGNVRELINRVRRALVMADGRLITPQDLGLDASAALVPAAALDDARSRTERTALRECLQRSGQNVSRAARALGVSRTTMYRLLNKHGMHP
jgi:DNA-binding NtrC family response regulator